jgi:hypothetical protein
MQPIIKIVPASGFNWNWWSWCNSKSKLFLLVASIGIGGTDTAKSQNSSLKSLQSELVELMQPIIKIVPANSCYFLLIPVINVMELVQPKVKIVPANSFNWSWWN